MVDCPVLALPTEPSLVIKRAAQLTADGETLVNGEDALNLAAKGYRPEPENKYSLQSLAELCVQDTLPNRNHATLQNAQLIVSGLTLAFGVHVVRHVVEEPKLEEDTYKDQQSMVVRDVLETLKKLGIVPQHTVQLIVNGMYLEIGVIAARIVVEDGKGEREP